MYTRQDYMTNKCTHRQFYAQFVNDEVKNAVIRMVNVDPSKSIQILREKLAKDEHLNNIPMKKWDNLTGFSFSNSTGEMLTRPYSIEPIDIRKLKEADEEVSSATLVCIYKEAAKELTE
jgi:hypothetical protein